MHIKVNVYSSLRYYMPAVERLNKEKDWEVPQDAPVSLVLEKMKLPKEVRVTVLVNDNSVDRKAILKEGDIVHILPQMAGG
jgi:molybdopterin converting factor small subunit